MGKKTKKKRKRINKLLNKPYTKFVFERIKRVLELRGVDLGYRRSRNYLPFPEDLPLPLTPNPKNQMVQCKSSAKEVSSIDSKVRTTY